MLPTVRLVERISTVRWLLFINTSETVKNIFHYSDTLKRVILSIPKEKNYPMRIGVQDDKHCRRPTESIWRKDVPCIQGVREGSSWLIMIIIFKGNFVKSIEDIFGNFGWSMLVYLTVNAVSFQETRVSMGLYLTLFKKKKV